MVLTCDYAIDRKKNFAIKKEDELEQEFHYPYQPLVVYTYNRNGIGKKRKTRIYDKEKYEEELRMRGG